MKDSGEPKKKSFLKKHWSNILFIGLLIVFFIPNTRALVQSWIILPLIGAPEIIDENDSKDIAEYNLSLSDLSGNLVSLNRSKNKPMLINFWATWCTPCLAELPDLAELHKEFGDKVDFYFVSNESKSKLISFLRQKNYNIPVYNPASEVPKFYKTESIPTTYLINSEGKIIAKAQGMADWNNDKVKKLIMGL
jgi:thiol-disulfide isomerase/thioredoxin